MLSEDAYKRLTGQEADVTPGTYMSLTNREETSFFVNQSAREFTNMTTREQLATEFAGFLHYDLLAKEIVCCVLDNEDYARISEGLTDEWRGRFTGFNVDGKDSYPFANAFYHRFVSSFDESCARPSYYDRVQKIRENEAGIKYWGDKDDDISVISYEMSDSFTFRTFWVYQPDFRILNQNDYLRNMAVMFMMFLFIFIVCLITALVVCYTRCQSIALNNRYIFDDLKKLGASPVFLDREVRSQCGNVFKTPSLVGTSAMFFLFFLILYANDGKMRVAEWAAMGVCLCIIALIGLVIYAVYRVSVRSIKGQLRIG